jgi:unsaturated rhamnogalacturonyl hydrolase
VHRGYLPKIQKGAKTFNGLTVGKNGSNGQVIIIVPLWLEGGNPYRDGSFKYYVNERKKKNDQSYRTFILAALDK